MLKHLRHKFTLINMILVTLVIVVVFTVVLMLNHQQNEAKVDASLNLAMNASTSLGIAANAPVDAGMSAPPDVGMNTPSDAGMNAPSDAGMNTPPDASEDVIGHERGPNQKKDDIQYIPVALYLLESEGALTPLSIDKVSLSNETLELATDELATSGALDADNRRGKLTDLGLYYLVRATPDGVKVAFADTSFVDSSIQALGLILLGVGVATLAVFFVISLFLARWALRPVETAWVQQQQFIADASHELKTPLTVILANNSILMSHPETKVSSQMQWIESTQSESLLMQGLINDLLFLAQPEGQERSKRLFSQVDLSKLLETDLLQFESVAFERSIDLQSNVEADVTMLGDEQRLMRLVGTLLDNACKYANTGGYVRVTLQASSTQATLRFTNSGVPIDAQDLPSIFDRFYRADKSRARQTGGYGLGLAIAKDVVDEHGGTITVTSDAVAGTSFLVTLPRR